MGGRSQGWLSLFQILIFERYRTHEEVSVRNRTEPITIRIITDLEQLPLAASTAVVAV